MFDLFGSAEEIRPRITSQLLLTALDYWLSISPANGFPRRQSINPMALPKLLPTTFIVKAEDDGGFRYLLAGSLFEEKYQLGTLRDKAPEDVMGAAAINVKKPYERVTNEGGLFYREATLEWVTARGKFTH
jgi:hypothetical protein